MHRSRVAHDVLGAGRPRPSRRVQLASIRRPGDPVAIAAAAEELGVTWPIALDTRQRNFFGWQGSRGYWPRTYVIDQAGQVRFDHIGEGKYEELAATVDYLLTESA